MSSDAPPKSGRKVMSLAVGVTAIVVLIVIAGIGWGLYAIKPEASTAKLSTAQQEQIVTALAYEHWNAIGMENLNTTMSQYSSSAVLYWYMENTSYDSAYNGALNGVYSSTSGIRAEWAKFFAESVVYYWVGGFGVSIKNNTASVTAKLWYIISNGTVVQSANVSSQLFTLIVPYLLTYQYTSSGWVLTSDWWGLPGSLGTVVPGAYGLQQYLKEKLPFPK